MLLKIQKSNQKMVGISTYSSDKKGTSVAWFWLSFYADAYNFLFFLPFFWIYRWNMPQTLIF